MQNPLNTNQSEYPGNLFVIAAPSGAGKTSLVTALIKTEKNIVHSISYTTRPMRPQEEDGVNYHFISVDAFNAMIEKQLFLEWAPVFTHYYGTSSQSIYQQLEQGLDIILEIDWQGAKQIKTLFPNSLSIFILPPSREVLRQRLQARKQDKQDVIDHRMSKASDEMAHYPEFDYLIINDHFEESLSNLAAIIKANRFQQSKQASFHEELLTKLLEKP